MHSSTSGFPDMYANIPTASLLAAFDQGPKRIGTVLENLTSEDLRTRPRPRPGKWSIREIVLHVADSEIMGAGRIRQTFAQPGSRYAVYDQDVWAEILEYNNGDNNSLQNALQLFSSLRVTTSAILQRARQDDWSKTGVHAEHGVVTLRNLLELYAATASVTSSKYCISAN